MMDLNVEKSVPLLLILASWTSAAAAQPAQTQTAGERFKSVRVLTDTPAALIIPTMAFISNALGVTCLHCHTDVYESDEKPMKDKARDMIRMTRALNDTQFGGQRIVTCETCHHGSTRPNAVPPIENAGWYKRPLAPTTPLPEIAAVLEKFDNAVGVASLSGLRSQKLTGTITRNSGRTPAESDTFELVQQTPATLRLVTALSHPPEADVELPMTFLRPSRIRATYPDLHVTARESIGDEAVIVTVGTSTRGQHRLYFSERSGLLVRRSDEIDTPLGAVAQRYDFSNFRRIDGVQVPMTIGWSRADYHVVFEGTAVTHDR